MSLVDAADGTVSVEYGQFWVTAGASDDIGPEYTGADDFLEVGGSGLLCISAGGYHEASLRLEFWRETPPATAAGEWEEERTVSLTRGRGPAYGLPLSGGPTVCELPLDVPEGEPIQARVCCRGRGRVMEWFAQGNVENPPTGTEEWRVQFWQS